MTKLFAFTIGPVKSFVENSRKTTDLRAGSSILSRVTGETLKCLAQMKNVEIIFPNEDLLNETDNSTPNRLVAIITDIEVVDPHQLGCKLEQAAREAFRKICDDALESGGVVEDERPKAYAQLDNYLETYWFCSADDDYASAYGKMTQGLNDIKRMRMFKQSAEPWGRKCILFQDLNAIFIKESAKKYPYNTNPNHIIRIPETDKTKHIIKDNEALSAVAFVKRMYPRTSGNIDSFRQMMLQDQIPEDMFVQYMRNDHRDSDIANAVYDLYHEAVDFDEIYDVDIQKIAECLLKSINRSRIRLSSYYAIVKFDGDGMGDVYCKDASLEKHRKLSETTCKFAQDVKRIVEHNHGQWIYAGGEDFLGALPLANLFTTMLALRKSFRDCLPGLTFSAGIVVAHLMQPLKEVLAQSNEMERDAKARPNKNAFSIGVLKRGGEFVKICYGFGDDDINMVRLMELVEAMRDKKYSKSLLFNLITVLEKIKYIECMQRDELVRVLIREAVQSAKTDDAEKLFSDLFAQYEANESIEQFIGMLNAIGFIVREVTPCFSQ